ncbi:hypothetical protein ACF09C_21335 [Streptomyces sp. NPDC014870]|uniref:hypothetical protein n=1 Tax=Streptomyces sp. NPDC014870 TaxID=3364925 RepID=UPI0036F6DC71
MTMFDSPLPEAGGPSEWLAFDRVTRDEIRYGRPTALGDVSAPGLASALCHPSGRVREATLARAAEAAPELLAEVLPLVAVRCADWAEPVRDRALEVLEEALGRPLLPPGLTATAGVILAVSGRLRGAAALELLEEAVAKAGPATVRALLAAPDRATRRFAHRWAAANGRLPVARLARTAAADPDVLVREECVEAVLAAVRAGADPALLDSLLGARWPGVRSAGVTALHGAGRHREAEGFLADRSRVVRACARWVVRQVGADPAEWYRRRCAEGTLPPYAPLGLAECRERTDEDTVLLRALTGHPVARVRASAVAGLRVLAPHDWRGVLPLLDDPSAAVVREVAHTLVAHAYRVPAEELLTRAAPDRPYPQRAAALRVFSERYDGLRLLCALRMLDDPDSRLRERAARSAGRGWWVAGRESREEAEEMLGLLERHPGALADWAHRSLTKGLTRAVQLHRP